MNAIHLGKVAPHELRLVASALALAMGLGSALSARPVQALDLVTASAHLDAVSCDVRGNQCAGAFEDKVGAGDAGLDPFSASIQILCSGQSCISSDEARAAQVSDVNLESGAAGGMQLVIRGEGSAKFPTLALFEPEARPANCDGELKSSSSRITCARSRFAVEFVADLPFTIRLTGSLSAQRDARTRLIFGESDPASTLEDFLLTADQDEDASTLAVDDSFNLPAGTYVLAVATEARPGLSRSTSGPPGQGTSGEGAWNLEVTVSEEENPCAAPGAILGTPGDDVLEGTPGNDTLCGLEGDDRILGGEGDDRIFGGPGDDALVGGGGADLLDGGPGSDDICGDYATVAAVGALILNCRAPGPNPGDDTIRGGVDEVALLDRLLGGPGQDTITAQTPSVIEGGPGQDVLFGSPHIDIICGDDLETDGDDQETDKNQSFTCVDRRRGDLGVADRDFISGLGGPPGTNPVADVQLIMGGPGHDFIEGGDDRDEIQGGPGDDEIKGGKGRDDIDGGDGRDKLSGEQGNDRLLGGPGNDVLLGGPGRDVLVGGGGRDRLLGQGGPDTLRALDGNADLAISGGAGNDQAEVDPDLDPPPVGVEALIP